MENFIFSINVALPILFVILIGLFLKKRGFLDQNAISALDKFSFRVGMPLLMFKNISEMDFYAEFSLKFILFCAIFSLATFLIIWFVALRLFPDRPAAGSFAQGSVRGSVSVLGVSIVANIYGTAGIAAVMISATVPIYNAMSIIILTCCGTSGKVRLRDIVHSIFTNPLVIGILCGLPFALLRIEVPEAAASTVDTLSATATPLALIVIGASFNRADATARLRPALLATLIKLVIMPCIGMPIAIWLGFRDAALTSLLLMTSTATAPASYIMARNMGCDGPLASNIVLLSTMFFSFTLAAWLFALRSFGLI
ncbi:MAG TPA: AEC family transporter [Firmicutes bacterium]|nr:AEC family transporter [Bacillota bacterium]